MAYHKDWDKYSVDQKLAVLNQELNEAIAHWIDIHDNGCFDPFWPDGTNMNLVRNHIIFYLREISELDQKPRQMSMFDLMMDTGHADDVMSDKRIPPLVSDEYMAHERKCSYFNTLGRMYHNDKYVVLSNG